MKKFFSMTLLLTAMFLTFSACSSDDDGYEDPKTPEGTFVNFTYTFEGEDLTPQGIFTTITIFEYNSKNEKIEQHTDIYLKGSMDVFKAKDMTEKVKIYISVSKDSEIISTAWVQQVYYLKKDGYNRIVVTGNTRVGPNEP